MTFEYIRGLTEGEGCFTFSVCRRMSGRRYKLPCFIIGMHERDRELLKLVRDKLELNIKIYNRPAWRGDGIQRGRSAILIVRRFNHLKDVIIPLFYKKLHGHKGKQFVEWLEKIGKDPDISDRFKSLYRIYKWGIYDQPKFINKFFDH